MLDLIYQIGKDVIGIAKGKYEWKADIKNVNLEYIEKSGLKEKIKSDGYSFKWSLLNNVETLKLDGWEIIYEIDETTRTKYQLVVNNELTLIGFKGVPG